MLMITMVNDDEDNCYKVIVYGYLRKAMVLEQPLSPMSLGPHSIDRHLHILG